MSTKRKMVFSNHEQIEPGIEPSSALCPFDVLTTMSTEQLKIEIN